MALTARHLLEKWQLILETLSPEQGFGHGNARQPPPPQQARRVRSSPLTQAQLFSEERQLASSMGAVPCTMQEIAAMQEADAIARTCFPELGGGGTKEKGRFPAEGGAFGTPGRIARSASSRPAQAARYASSPDVLWPLMPSPEPLACAATVAAVPQLLLGGGRARPRPQASKKAKGAAADARQATRLKKPAKRTGSLSGVRGIAALEKQLQQLKANVAKSGDLDWPSDLDGLPEPDTGNFDSQSNLPATAADQGRQERASSMPVQHNRSLGNKQTAASTGLDADFLQSQAFWSSEPGVDVAGLGTVTGSDARPEEDEPFQTDARSKIRQASRVRQGRLRQTKRAGRPGGSCSAATGEGTRAQTPSSTEDAGSSRKRGPCDKTLWSDEEKARYIAVLQEHGRDLTQLCAAFPDKCVFPATHAFIISLPAAVLMCA